MDGNRWVERDVSRRAREDMKGRGRIGGRVDAGTPRA